jgi:tetratricopeptide (TPR) repeat protein
MSALNLLTMVIGGLVFMTILAALVYWMFGSPIIGMFTGGNIEVDPEPRYSIAEAKRQRGDFEGALAEIRSDLEKFPGDFRLMMLMAAIQAENLYDLPGAQLTVERLLEYPDHPIQHVAAALHTMADWCLKYAEDPVAAREYLERIVVNYPNSPQAHMAAQRIAALGEGRHRVDAARGRKFQLKSGEKNIGLRQVPQQVAQSEALPDQTAAELVRQLEAHPLDTAAREKLAVVYAEEYRRIDLAADQLEQLIAVPAETPKNIARWLNLLATLHIKVNRDRRAAEDTLRRIVALFPNTSHGDLARQRLAYIDAELRSKQVSEPMKLGVYEQDMGLKKPLAGSGS